MRIAKVLIPVALCLAAVAVAAPVAGAAVVLNEVNCEGTDWVELVNTGEAEADVSGWLLTDDPIDAAPPRADHRFTLPAGSIPASGSITFDKGSGGFPSDRADDSIRLADAAGAPVDDVVVPALVAGTDTGPAQPARPMDGDPRPRRAQSRLRRPGAAQMLRPA